MDQTTYVAYQSTTTDFQWKALQNSFTKQVKWLQYYTTASNATLEAVPNETTQKQWHDIITSTQSTRRAYLHSWRSLMCHLILKVTLHVHKTPPQDQPLG